MSILQQKTNFPSTTDHQHPFPARKKHLASRCPLNAQDYRQENPSLFLLSEDIQKNMQPHTKKQKRDLSYLSTRRLQIKRKTRINKCYICNNYFVNRWTNVWTCPLCCLADISRVQYCCCSYPGCQCQEEKPSSSPSPCSAAPPPSSPSAACPSETQEKKSKMMNESQ